MIVKASTKRIYGLVSVAVAASILMQWLIIPKIQWDRVLAEGETPVPTQQDSASITNYASVLGHGTDYGIIANVFNRGDHTETTYAVNVLNKNGGSPNDDIDFITRPAHFMIGEVNTNDGTNLGLCFGNNTSTEYFIEAPQGVLDTLQVPGAYSNTWHGATVHEMPTSQETIRSSISTLTSNAQQSANTFNSRANSSDYQFPLSLISSSDASVTSATSYIYYDNDSMDIHLGSEYDGKVVYINVTADMLGAISTDSGVNITKPDSTVVVFNFPRGLEVNSVPVSTVTINKILVNGVSSETGPNGTDRADTHESIDSTICQRIIWNFPTSDYEVRLYGAGGLFNAPSSNVVCPTSPSCGWIIADTVTTQCEFHFIYQNTSELSLGGWYFTLDKRLTTEYGYNEDEGYAYPIAGKNPVVVDNRTQNIQAGQFAFIWQELDKPYSDPAHQVLSSQSCPIGSGALNNRVVFPALVFYTDDAHSSDAHYIPTTSEGGSKTFYFRIYEDPNYTAEGISNSDGYVDIALTVNVSASGVYSYDVVCETITGEGNDTFRFNYFNGTATGDHFDIGSFYNLISEDVQYGNLSVTKIVDGISDLNTLTHDPVYYFTITRDIGGTTYYYDANGGRTTTYTEVPITVNRYSSQGSINNTLRLPYGTYVITEINKNDTNSITTSSGTYTIESGAHEETVIIDASNSYRSVSITNNYLPDGTPTATLTVDKVFDGDTVTGSFYYTVYNGSQYLQADGSFADDVHYFSITENASTNPTHTVPYGTYTVTEYTDTTDTARTAQRDGYTLVVTYDDGSDSTNTITFDANTTAGTITIHNDYSQNSTTPVPGTLTIDKVIGSGNDYAAANSQTYSFYVYSEDSTGRTYYDVTGAPCGSTQDAATAIPVVGDGETPVTVPDVSLTYYVVEASSSVAGYRQSITYTFNNTTSTAIPSVTFSGTSTTATVEVTNTYTAMVTLTIDKVVDCADAITGPFYYTIRTGTQYLQQDGATFGTTPYYFSIAADAATNPTYTLPAGSYVVEEVTTTDSSAADYQYTAQRTGYDLVVSYDNGGTPASNQINLSAAGDAGTVVITNKYTANSTSTCSVDLGKITVGGVELPGAVLSLTGVLANGTDAATFTTAQFNPGTGANLDTNRTTSEMLVFISGDNPSTVSGLLDGTYTLREIAVPAATTAGTYTAAVTDIQFTVSGGAVTSVTGATTVAAGVTPTGNTYALADGTHNAIVSLFDDFTQNTTTTTVSISKITVGGNELPGAVLTLTGPTGTTFTTSQVTGGASNVSVSGNVLTFTSGSTPASISGLGAGTYTLHEQTKPADTATGSYSAATDIEFSIATDGTVTVTSGAVSGVVNANTNQSVYRTENGATLIAMFDNFTQNTTPVGSCDIDIDKVSVGGVELPGAILSLTGTDATGAAVTFTDAQFTPGTGAFLSPDRTSTDLRFVSGSSASTISNLPDGDYVLRETAVPSSTSGTYQVATTITFSISGGNVIETSVTGVGVTPTSNTFTPGSANNNVVFAMFDDLTVDPVNTDTPTPEPSTPSPSEPTPSETTPSETTPAPSDDSSPAVPMSGCLVISKTISGTALNELETITFVLTDTSCGATREVPALTLENVANGLWGDAGNGTYYYIVTGLTPGVTYSVVESLDGHTTTYTLDAASSVTSASATVVANDTVTVTLTNAYTADGTTPSESTEPTEETSETTPSEPIASVTLDGQPLEPGSYTVNPDGTITLNDAVRRSLGSGEHTITITYVNGATRTITITIDSVDRTIGSTGETSVNIAAAVILLSSMACVYFSRKLRESAEEE